MDFRNCSPPRRHQTSSISLIHSTPKWTPLTLTTLTIPVPRVSALPLTVDESDVFLDDIDDLSRTANMAQNRRRLSATRPTGGRQQLDPARATPSIPAGDFDLADYGESGGSNTVLSFPFLGVLI
jgi:hypothetical protein